MLDDDVYQFKDFWTSGKLRLDFGSRSGICILGGSLALIEITLRCIPSIYAAGKRFVCNFVRTSDT